MAHGTPLGLAGNDERYGAEGAFLIEAGISSSYHIANFFGLTDRVSEAGEAAEAAVDGRKAGHAVGGHGVAAVAGSRRHAVVAGHKPVRQSKPVPHEAEAPRHRCRRRHYPRADGGGTDEIDAATVRRVA